MISNGSLPLMTSARQGRVGRLVGQVFFAGKEAQKRPPLLRDMVADGAAQHGIARLESVEDRAQRRLALDFELYFALDVRQVRRCCGNTTRIMLVSAPRPKARAEDREQWAPSCRRHRATRTPGLRSCRSKCRRSRAYRQPSRLAVRSRSSSPAADPFVSGSHSLPPRAAAEDAQLTIERKVLGVALDGHHVNRSPARARERRSQSRSRSADFR